jgi:hypothetical protein
MNGRERPRESLSGEPHGDAGADVVRVGVDELLVDRVHCSICGIPVSWHRDPFTREWTGCFDTAALEARARLRSALRHSIVLGGQR